MGAGMQHKVQECSFPKFKIIGTFVRNFFHSSRDKKMLGRIAQLNKWISKTKIKKNRLFQHNGCRLGNNLKRASVTRTRAHSNPINSSIGINGFRGSLLLHFSHYTLSECDSVVISLHRRGKSEPWCQQQSKYPRCNKHKKNHPLISFFKILIELPTDSSSMSKSRVL